MVLASNDKDVFVIYLYNKLQWTNGTASKGVKAVVSYRVHTSQYIKFCMTLSFIKRNKHTLKRTSCFWSNEI